MFFHFSQVIYKKVQLLELQQLFYTNALGFLPVEYVVAGFELLQEEQGNQFPQLGNLFTYIQDTWIGKLPLAMWKVRNLGTRTNNRV